MPTASLGNAGSRKTVMVGLRAGTYMADADSLLKQREESMLNLSIRGGPFQLFLIEIFYLRAAAP